MLANQARIASTTANFAVLEGVHYQLDPGDFKLRWEVYGWPKKIYDKMDAVELALQKQEASYQTDMEEAQEGYREGLRSMMDEVENLRIYTDLKRVDQVGGWLCGRRGGVLAGQRREGEGCGWRPPGTGARANRVLPRGWSRASFAACCCCCAALLLLRRAAALWHHLISSCVAARSLAPPEVANYVRNLKKKLSEADEEARVYNSREALFGKEVTEYSLLKDISKSFEPYCDMWESVDTWLKSHKRWMEVGRVVVRCCVGLPPRRSSG